MKTSTKTVISINNISKVYEGPPPVRALDGVSLEIKEGDFVSIVGQSGSGKSTFLNMIGLLDSCLLYTSPSPRDQRGSRMPSSA